MADAWWPAVAVDSWEVGEKAGLGLTIPQRELSRGEALVFKLGSWVSPSERWDVVRRCSPYVSSSSSSNSTSSGRMLGAGEGGNFNECMLDAAKTEAKALAAPLVEGETRRSRMGRGFVFWKGMEEEEEEGVGGGGRDVEPVTEGNRQRGKRKGGREEVGEEKKDEKAEMDVKKPILMIRFKTKSTGAVAATAAAPPPPVVPARKRHRGRPPTRGGETLFENTEEEEEEKEDEDKSKITSKNNNRSRANPLSTNTHPSLPPSRPLTPEEVEKIRRLAEGLLFMDQVDRAQNSCSLRHDLNALRLFISRGKEMKQFHLMRLEKGLRAYMGRMRAQLLQAKRDFGRWEEGGGRVGGGGGRRGGECMERWR